jgi:hypothetical protein
VRAKSASLDVIFQSFRDWWDDWVFLSILNLIGLLCWLTIILGPPATFGLYYFSNHLAHGENIDFKGLLDGGRLYFFHSWLWMLTNLVAAIIISGNIWFYASFDQTWANFLQAFFIILGVFWVVIQFYTVPYLMEQERKNLLIAWRNGLFTILAFPGYTLVVVGVAALVALLSVVLIFPLFLGAPCLILLLGNRSVIERMETFQVSERETDQKILDRKDLDEKGEQADDI